MRIKLYNQYFYTKTLINLIILPFYDLNKDLKSLYILNPTIIFDCTGEFYLNTKLNIKILLISPSYKELLKILKYIDLNKYKILIINNLQTFLNKKHNKFYIKNLINKLWYQIYEYEITIIMINGFEKNGEKLIPKYDNIINKLISYQISILNDSVKILSFESENYLNKKSHAD